MAKSKSQFSKGSGDPDALDLEGGNIIVSAYTFSLHACGMTIKVGPQNDMHTASRNVSKISM